jgi:carboxypeptidase C (cathepsin A)
LFAFNGGPASAAVWLHLGWLGPHRLATVDQLTPSPPLWAVVDNPDALLDVAGLVLVDPPGTGWSRRLQADRAPAFYRVEEDAEASLRFVRA